MKLNVKQTVKIGLGFMTIMLLWGVYNWYVPLFLDEFLNGLFKGDDLVIGIVMSLDNLVALFMIPIMSHFSDKCKSKLGKRTPFIIIGILLSATFFVLIPIVHTYGNIFLLLVVICLVLISMNIYRSPCVALMPDVTPKSLRGKGNSVINIMGGVGTALAYLTILVFGKRSELIPFAFVTVIMYLVVIFFLFFIKENKYLEEYHKIALENNLDLEEEQKEEVIEGGSKVTNKRNVIFALLIVLFAYMGNNAAETFMSMYSAKVFTEVTIFDSIELLKNFDLGILIFIPFGAGVFAFSVPAGIFGDKLGRKTPIVIGTLLLSLSYLGIGILGYTLGFSLWMLLFFFTGGCSFALVTINSYPLVVESCSTSEIGVYTGKYYTASMIAQSITPALCGFLFSSLVFDDIRIIFPYCAISLLLAFISSLFIKKK